MNIEDLIKKRKENLDIDSPPSDLWDGIKKDWKKEKSAKFSWWKVAAVIFIATSVGLLIHNISLQNTVDELASLGDISTEYRELENNYVSQINQLEADIPMKELKSSEDFQWILEELKTLEEVNKLYRQDIGKINEEQLVGVLVDYYEKKIKLLRKLELEIKRANKFKDNEETDTDSIRM
ncbi:MULTISPECIES: hypothetical protein [unclassified Ekhidna]|jgi:hypothetical protein|uniref:hypothetical protein n=1 Tax=unclassified Ekhidna TaxID=2632188 RepID=UPI0032DE67E4